MSRRLGLSLIELLIVIAIIGLLFALLLTGVQSARETSRRIGCSSNLRQFALAISMYESTHGVFPAGSNWKHKSPHYVCLPYMEQSALANEAVEDPNIPLGFFCCPSDGGPAIIVASPQDIYAMTNYACNSGIWWDGMQGFDGPFRHWRPVLRGGPPLPASAMSRGLSNTSAVAEVIHADASHARMRANWNSLNEYDEIDLLAQECENLPGNPYSVGYVGNPYGKAAKWSRGGVSVTLYNHVTLPNQPSCYNGSQVATAAFSASGFHRGIVNVAYLDGHVDMCSDKIDRRTWRRLAPR
jgi:prepilin-type N-terminal cleavage/methylation domain-containing protein/prepilin-type processing-associated H-X9-DG protein